MAVGCLAGLRARGLQVPDDMVLVGFDDIPFSRYLTPPLTTVQVAISELGSRAATRVVQALSGTAPSRRHEVAADHPGRARLVWRAAPRPQEPQNAPRAQSDRGGGNENR